MAVLDRFELCDDGIAKAAKPGGCPRLFFCHCIARHSSYPVFRKVRRGLAPFCPARPDGYGQNPAWRFRCVKP